MVIIGSVSFPTNSSDDAGKSFLELPNLADFITRKGPYILSVKGDGIQTISVFEFDNSKMAEAMNSITNYYATMRGVPGLTYSVNVYMEIQEALGMIGLA